MNAPLVLAAGQAACAPLDVAANVATAARLVRRASAEGAELLVLPELFLTGPDLTAAVVEPAKYTIGETDARLDPLADACAETRTAVVLGAPIWEDGQVFNSLHVIGRSGQPAGRYDKQHLTAAERATGINQGAHGHTVTLDSWRIGLAIGADADDPEHARAAARDGCLIYLVSAQRPAGTVEVLAERAGDNGLYTVLAGTGTGVWHPEGTLLAEADGEVTVAEIVRV
jgi:5-aminopentanamidase